MYVCVYIYILRVVLSNHIRLQGLYLSDKPTRDQSEGFDVHSTSPKINPFAVFPLQKKQTVRHVNE